MTYAVIDIGTNTVRLCLYRIENGKPKMVLNRRVMALLGSKVEDGALTNQGIDAVCGALESLMAQIRNEKVNHTLVFATAALRNITNTEAVVLAIRERVGLDVHVLSGEEEALLTFKGASKEQEISEGLIADIGGGSTELVLIKDGGVVQTASLPIGSLTAFVQFVKERPVHADAILAIRSYVRSMIKDHFSQEAKATVLYGIGGAARTAMELEKILYPGAGGAIQTLETLLARLLDDEKLAETSILKASPERLDAALPGVAILCEVAALFGCERLGVCRGGVREGYLWEQLEKIG
ncbi:MAG: hypothetical protein IKW06_00690 [Clostridia bacterium]|nr:hypothetical protein [Clostridia bacterium]